MRKIFIAILISLTACYYGLGQERYNIKFNIHNFEDSIVYIRGAYGKDYILLDTMYKDKDGSFYVKNKVLHKGIGVVATPKADLFTFLIDKSTNFEVDIYPNGDNMVKGCEDNDLYLEFQRANILTRYRESQLKDAMGKAGANKDSIVNQINIERERFVKFQENFYKTYPNHIMSVLVKALEDPAIAPEFIKDSQIDKSKAKELQYYFKKHYWDNFPLNDNRLIGTPYFFSKLKSYFDEIVYQNADSITLALKDFVDLAKSKQGDEYAEYAIKYFLTSNEKTPVSFNEGILVGVVDKLINQQYTPWLLPSEIENYQLKAQKIRPILPKNKIPNITLKDLKGKTHSLYDIKTKYTVLYFWSAGCESCKMNLDVLEKLYKDSKDSLDFEVFSIDLDYDLEESINFSKKHPFDWIVVKSDAKEIKSKYGLDIELTPDIYVLDADKRILNHTPLYQHIEKTITTYNKK